MSTGSQPAIGPGRYVIGRSSSALPCPLLEDVGAEVADLLPEFTDEALRESYRGETMAVTLGLLRAREMFPRSNRFHTKALVSWENRTRATVSASDAFELICGARLAPLMPYAALAVSAFGNPLRAVIREIHRRLQLDPFGFSLLWMGGGGHVTPLHHDGSMVHGRWHLVVRGAKQFDFMPPGSPRVPRLPWWDLYRRFSRLYKSPLPDSWLTEGCGAHRIRLAPGQMVTWGRGWWHRVEIPASGVTIGLSTRGQRPDERLTARGVAHLMGSRILGEAEHFLDALGEEPPARTLEDLQALLDARPPTPEAPEPTLPQKPLS